MDGRKKTSGQNKAIFGAASAAGLDIDMVRDVVESITSETRKEPTRSISDLSYAEAERVLARIKGKSFVPLRTMQYRRQKAGVKQLVQQSQLDLIAELAAQRHWSRMTLGHFCFKVCKRPRPLTTDEASKVIEALKAMNKREGLWVA